MKRLFTIFAVILHGHLANAQPSMASALKPQTGFAMSKEGDAISAPQSTAFNSPVSLQLLAGTQGLGADVKYGILQNLSARLGFGIVPVNGNRGFSFSSFRVNGELAARFANVHLMADYAPFKSKLIRLVGGAAYLIKGNANVLISPVSDYSIGSRELSKNQLGVIDAEVNWRGFAPYAGLSLLRPFPAHRFNVNLDLGTYYLSRPGTSFIGTNLLANNEASAQRFNENMKGYRWMPVMQINFNIKIK